MTKSRPRALIGSILIFLASLLGTLPARAEAQDTTAKPLTRERLEQLVAPIALYPDSLLSQVLMASTYPLEVVEAARWSSDNPNVTGKELEDAMQKQPWDPSVKALTAVPQTLQMMNDQLRWTQELGDAFLENQAGMFDAVQQLRARADNAGNLKTTPEQRVTRVPRPPAAARTAGAPATAYVIEPATPEQIFVPVYDPRLVYGAWPYAAYEPFYWYPPGYIGPSLWGFGAGLFVGAAIWGGVNWWNRNVNVNVNRYNQFNRANINNANWAHNAAHRRGVPYSNPNVANRFGDQGRSKAREAARQKAGQGKGAMGAMGPAGKGPMGPGGKGPMGPGGKGAMGPGGKGAMAGGKGGMGGMGPMGPSGMGAPMGMAMGAPMGGMAMGAPMGGMAMGGPMGGMVGGPMGFSGPMGVGMASSFMGGGRGFSGARLAIPRRRPRWRAWWWAWWTPFRRNAQARRCPSGLLGQRPRLLPLFI